MPLRPLIHPFLMRQSLPRDRIHIVSNDTRSSNCLGSTQRDFHRRKLTTVLLFCRNARLRQRTEKQQTPHRTMTTCIVGNSSCYKYIAHRCGRARKGQRAYRLSKACLITAKSSLLSLYVDEVVCDRIRIATIHSTSCVCIASRLVKCPSIPNHYPQCTSQGSLFKTFSQLKPESRDRRR